MKLALLAASIGSAAALCAESCNGHGKCGAYDKCECYDNWSGPACKNRVCAYSHSWAGNGAHGYAECGNKGECDRGTGLCKCFDGYTGKGCDRLACVGEADCNGHGTCERFGDENSGYLGWDKDKIMTCKCDPGYTGPGCESRMCKPGDDPMTPLGAYHVTEIVIDGGDTTPSGTFYLSFKDWRGQTWDTWALEAVGANGESKPLGVEEALEALPNHAVPDVNVSHIVTGSGFIHTWQVTFVSPHNTGDQSGKLTISTAGCTIAGCQPYYTGMTVGTGGDKGSITDTVQGANEDAVCSNRGTCDTETGICSCVDGFYGEACEKQTIIL